MEERREIITLTDIFPVFFFLFEPCFCVLVLVAQIAKDFLFEMLNWCNVSASVIVISDG